MSTSTQARPSASRAEGIRDMVLAQIKRAGIRGLTAEECSERLSLPRGTVQPRTTELKNEGLIVKSDDRRMNLSSGKSAVVWIAP